MSNRSFFVNCFNSKFNREEIRDMENENVTTRAIVSFDIVVKFKTKNQESVKICPKFVIKMTTATCRTFCAC